MMCLYDELTQFVNRLEQCEELKNCKLLIAYPSLKKPTELKQIVIASSIGELDAKCIELGGSFLEGKYTLNANIYAPFDLGTSTLQAIIEPVIKSQMSAYPAGIKVGEIKVIEDIKCFCIKCSFTFNDEICIGG